MHREADRHSPSQICGRMWDWPIRSSRSRFLAVLKLSRTTVSGAERVFHRPLRGGWGPARASRLPVGRAAFYVFFCGIASLSLLTAGCAATAAVHRGREAEEAQNYHRAVVEYMKAVRLHPGDLTARTGLERAKLRASADHFQRGRHFAATGKYEEALIEYELASELNPTNPDLDQALKSTRNTLRSKVTVPREGKTELQALIERARDLAPPGLDLPTNVKMPASLTFRDASSKDIFTTIARVADISLVFDPSFREQPVNLDLRNQSLEDALNSVAGATHTFFRVIAPRTVTVIPDTPAKRREYEEEVVRTFYLS